MFVRLVRMSYFYVVGRKTGQLASPNEFSVTGTQLLKTHKTGTVPGTWGLVGTLDLQGRQEHSHRLFIRSETPVLLTPVGIQFTTGSFTPYALVATHVTAYSILLSPSLLAILFSM
jgi:hypothetical protein